jgi:hypothetical protein
MQRIENNGFFFLRDWNKLVRLLANLQRWIVEYYIGMNVLYQQTASESQTGSLRETGLFSHLLVRMQADKDGKCF